MAQRYIKDSFWTDSYIESLSPDHKLIFIYLLTNPQCNIAGVYEITHKRIAYETGFDIDVIKNILKRFEEDGKILQWKSYIALLNHSKHQSQNPSVEKGIERIYEDLPQELVNLLTPCTQTVDSVRHPMSNAVELSKVKLSNNKGIAFEEFWDIYPVKKGKQPSKKKWERFDRKTQETIISHVTERKQTDRQWIEGYIPHPTTFFNQQRWEDEYEKVEESQGIVKLD